MTILSIVLSLIYITLGILHFSWAMGSSFAFESELPTDENGKKVLNPGKFDCFIVGLGLIAFGLFYALKAGLLVYRLPEGLMNILGWIIPIIFLLRALGEFKYVGFFKRVQGTNFGKLDTWLYSPLCLAVSAMGVVVQLMM